MKTYGIPLLLLVTAGCASVRPENTLPSKAPRCAANLAIYREQLAKALADTSIDQPVFEDQQRRIAKIEKVCAEGDEGGANALLLDAAIGLNLGADDTYARSLNEAPR